MLFVQVVLLTRLRWCFSAVFCCALQAGDVSEGGAASASLQGPPVSPRPSTAGSTGSAAGSTPAATKPSPSRCGNQGHQPGALVNSLELACCGAIGTSTSKKGGGSCSCARLHSCQNTQ